MPSSHSRPVVPYLILAICHTISGEKYGRNKNKKTAYMYGCGRKKLIFIQNHHVRYLLYIMPMLQD